MVQKIIQKRYIYSYLFSFLIFLSVDACSKYIDNFLISSEEYAQFTEETREEELSLLNAQKETDIRSVTGKKSWTFIVYMAGDNDLNYFAWKNLKQMELIGSNENITIVAQLNNPGSAPTKRYVVRKDKRVLVQDQTIINQKLNSGSYQTLIDCALWATTYYPAENYALILWNHGTGAIDPHFGKTINPCELFYLNPTDNKLEIDRGGASYLALICNEIQRHIKIDNKRGICFDDSFKSYITNHDLELALHHITKNILNGKKLGIIGFDACLMSMIEISSICKNYAEYFVASQELEYGAGWKYDEVLKPFLDQILSPLEFAKHIVVSYEKAYQKMINDYTLAAFSLQFNAELEKNIDQVAQLLAKALTEQQNRSVSDILRKCKSTQYCTCFDEPSYIDLGHFYDNLLQHVSYINLKDKSVEAQIKPKLAQLLQQGKNILKNLVVENKVGSKLKNAQGVSIYFPEYSINVNYAKSPFALSNNWLSLLLKYIKG
jgi:hypothetical protein